MIKFEWRGDSEVSSPIFGNPCSGLLQQCKQIWTIHLRVGKASRENWGCWVWQSFYLNLCGGPQNVWIMPKKCNGAFISPLSDDITWHDRWPNIGFAGFKLPWIQTLSLYWDYWQLTSKINPLKNCSQFELWMSNLLRFSQISLIPAKSAENIKLWSETNWSKDGGGGWR